jgi:ammonium transporter Rh
VCAQALYQLAALGSTLAIAIVGGLLMGLLVAKLDTAVAGQELSSEHLFEDCVFWHEVEPEEAEHGAVNGTAAEE